VTEHSVVARHGKLELREYRASPRRYAVPVVLVPALISRASILDLYDGGSLAQYLTRAGFDAYLVDWGSPGDEDRELGLDDLLLSYLPPVLERIRTRSGSGALTLLGYCMGGTLVAIYAALAAWAPPNNVIALASPVDFAYGGKLAAWCAPHALDIDRVIDVFGNVPALLVETAFTMLRPTAKARAALRFFESANDSRAHEAYAALARWSDDWLPFPGRAAREWIKAFYQENRLIQGELCVGGERVDLGRITAPLLAIAAEHDEISPPDSVAPLVDRARSVDRSFLVLPGGHIGLVAGRSARDVLWPSLRQWLSTHSVKEAS
jgi:polyhydroxyalkanoate synthase subunit PhaC